MRQESCDHGIKTADMIGARKLSLQEQAVNHDLSKKAHGGIKTANIHEARKPSSWEQAVKI
jgi:hypothetical protein